MPTRKEWVVDEKGFHAKSVWEPAPADKTAVCLDDTSESSSNTKNEDKYEVELLKGTWLEGADCFQFNKKCTVRVEGKFLKETKRTRVTINTFVTFRDEKNNEDVKEDLGQAVDTNLEKVNKEGVEAVAEAEVMLFYGEKYNKALRENPELTCRYTFTAQSNVGKKILDSEPLTMPHKESDENFYGGFELKKGDNENKKIWGGKKQDSDGAYIAELQKDLFSLGYWITDGLKTQDPMVYDGDFGHGTYSGLKTFQYEHKESQSLKVAGVLDSKTAKVIKECIKKTSFKRPGVSVSLSNTKKFYQLPPSKNYKRYNAASPDYVIKKRSNGQRVTGELEDVYHNHLWGTEEVIGALEKLAGAWTKKADYTAATDLIEIGDISTWCGGETRHSTHKDGQGVDIRANSVGVLDRNEYKFNKDKSVAFAKLLKEKGFGRVITLCPHIAKTINTPNNKYVTLIKYHEHHYHIDYSNSGGNVTDEHTERAYCKNCKWKSSCDSQYKKVD